MEFIIERGLYIGFLIFMMVFGLWNIWILEQSYAMQIETAYQFFHSERFLSEMLLNVKGVINV